MWAGLSSDEGRDNGLFHQSAAGRNDATTKPSEVIAVRSNDLFEQAKFS